MRPDSPPHLVKEEPKNGPEENLPLGHCSARIAHNAKCVFREVDYAGKGRAGSRCGAVRYDSLGLNKTVRDAAPLLGFVTDQR